MISAFAAVVAVLAKFVRSHLVPEPEHLDGPAPSFRTPEPPPAAPEASTEVRGTDGDDLTEIHGVGPVYADRLADLGITSFEALAAADAAAIAEAVGVSDEQVAEWIADGRSSSRRNRKPMTAGPGNG